MANDTDYHGKCETCRFWEPSARRGTKILYGFCHIFPPQGRQWRQTKPEAWCGEYSAKAEQTPHVEGMR